MISKETLHLKSVAPYGYNQGAFFTYSIKTNQGGACFTCRESFGYSFNKNTRFVGFNKTGIDIEKIDKFFRNREIKLNIPEEERIVIYNTNVVNCIILEISPFWASSAVRRGMFTLFLRAAAVYYANANDNFVAALEAYDLARQVIPAILHFMDGYTVQTVKSLGVGGWEAGGFVNYFKKKPTDTLSLTKWLIKPPETAVDTETVQ